VIAIGIEQIMTTQKLMTLTVDDVEEEMEEEDEVDDEDCDDCDDDYSELIMKQWMMMVIEMTLKIDFDVQTVLNKK
jgi:hypothetical protein